MLNQLTELDLSNVPALTNLECSGNQLTGLDLSNVPALTDLTCIKNKISELDIRRNTNLKTLSCDPWVRIIRHDWQSFKRPKY
jgi:Leucine-rich repeat (LRR) protein